MPSHLVDVELDHQLVDDELDHHLLVLDEDVLEDLDVEVDWIRLFLKLLCHRMLIILQIFPLCSLAFLLPLKILHASSAQSLL